MKNPLSLIICLILLSGCADKITRKLRRADKLIKEAVALGAEIKADTVYQTKVLPGEKTTVEIPVLKVRDTVIYQDRIRLQYRLLHDTLKLTVDCPEKIIEVPVTVTKSIICPDCPKDRFWKGFGMGSALVLILLIVGAVARMMKVF